MNTIPNVNIKNSAFVNGLSHFKNPAAVLPTLLIEACCTTGRTYQSYKRGGALEAKERFREESTAAIFWLWGVKGLNKLGDILGEKVFKINDLMDTGKDALRDPAHLMSNKAKVFKFSKIISSVVIATGLIGFMVPKINHAITARALKNREKEKETSNQANLPVIDDFQSSAKKQDNLKYLSGGALAFTGKENLTNFIMKASYNLENNNKWRLISTDTGMIAGRVKNSRHPAEAFEYAFRDTGSIYFYNFAAGNMIFLLNKLFKTKDIHPKTIEDAGQYFAQAVKDKCLSPEHFLTITTEKKSAVLDKIKFDKDDVINVREFIKQFKELGENADESFIRKTLRMSQLQPKLRGERILSKQQVQDILSENLISNPKFLKKVINDATDGRALDKTKFVSRNTTEGIRDSLDHFAKEITNYAKKKGKAVDAQLIQEVSKKAIKRTAIFQGLGMAFSAFGLAILIPRLQIFLSQKVFGKKSFIDIAEGKDTKKDGTKAPSKG